MGRKPLPAHLKLLTGNRGKRPIKRDAIDPPPVMIDPPDFLADEAADEWRRIVPALYALRIFSELDVAALGAYCTAYANWKKALIQLNFSADDERHSGLVIEGKEGGPVVNPWLNVANRAAADMVKYAGEFGMSPVARARLAPNAEANPKEPAEKYFA